MIKTIFIASRTSEQFGRRWGPVGRLDYGDDEIYRFVYTRGAKMLQGFQPFTGLEKMDKVYLADQLFPLFSNRLLSPKRSDYPDFLRWCGLDADITTPSPLTILSVSEGIRATDPFEVFPCPIPDANNRYHRHFFLHGIQYLLEITMERIDQLEPDERLGLMFDISNSHDLYAIAVRTCEERDRHIIGYLPRYLARDIWALFERIDHAKMNATLLKVVRINPDAPTQQRILCHLEADWPDGFAPCSGEEYQPLINC